MCNNPLVPDLLYKLAYSVPGLNTDEVVWMVDVGGLLLSHSGWTTAVSFKNM
jgi:hypothetical protein